MRIWTRTHWLLAILFLIVISLEYSTPPPYVLGYLYIGAVLLASVRLGRRATLWVTGIAVGLTLLNLWIPGIEPITPITLANRIITVLALLVTAWLSDRLQQYEAAMLKQQVQLATQIQLAKVREDFVSTLTHDLKTPLLGAIETLNAFQAGQFGAVTHGQQRAIAIMMRSHRMTLQLVETLMDVYHNDTEGLYLHQEPVNLTSLAEEVILQLTPLATSRQIHLCLRQGNSDFRQTYWVQADALQLQRVFNNLITNAINHSPRGCKVEISLISRNNYFQVQIVDEGRGIPDYDLPNLFERFYQGHGDRQAKGAGLGLYLSRQIIEAHGGKIWAEPHSPQGAIFAFSLPIES
ncbi:MULTISPECIES: sensor histidine kinase [Synechocystis]|uniref:histidine kinase n=1 Tax=Synechocystis salina LEGE 00031 TaxID=1828736 RepID=A0ABR9VXH1_9SYNC|nr:MULTISPECIES: HAMP domain-containing sensor histidine kinase [Synechocystis]MBE9193855.1 HAMP domain-containing histidine kinase [Synechocystis sp. LEGE 06083]MBE9242736.1 HAMP domain-containing histidine kinase [Synechocystis salina LEGE 00041]MBE9255731.1 HAMP domain-containing histidine kinase [Synechocystis salina LEGE 00031]